MRDYAKACPRFWTGDFGKSIRGDHFLQALAWYLITAPAGNMIGLYVLPAGYIATDLGSPLKGTLKGLDRLGQSGFAHYDEAHETVWVVEQARHELGEALEESDNRVKRVRRLLVEHCKSRLFRPFLEMYATGYHLLDLLEQAPCEAPSQAPPEGVSRARMTRARSAPTLALAPSLPVLPPLPMSIDTPEVRAAWEERLHERAEMGPKGKLTPTQVAAQFRKLERLAAARGIAVAVACIERATEGHHQGIVFPEDFNNSGASHGRPARQNPRPAHPASSPDRLAKLRERDRLALLPREEDPAGAKPG